LRLAIRRPTLLQRNLTLAVLFESTRRGRHTAGRVRRADRIPAPELLRLVRSIADDPITWEPIVKLPDGSDRWWTRLYTGRRFDLWLLSWLPGGGTDLHDHGPSAAAFSVVRGALSEVRVDRQGRSHTYLRRAGSATALVPGVIHDVNGAGDGPAVSIHAYSPPLRRMTFYARDARGVPRLLRAAQTKEPEQEPAR
jgi:quercetin dioxygenase-like cupin family protein